MNSPIEIISGIWIGDLNHSQNPNFYKNNNIDMVVNCTCDTECINLDSVKFKIKIPFSRDFPSRNDILVINEYIEKLLQIIYKSIDNHNIFIYSYNKFVIPLQIISIFIIKYGKISKEVINDIIKSKIDAEEVNIDLGLYNHLIT